jgi:hypothetical protein
MRWAIMRLDFAFEYLRLDGFTDALRLITLLSAIYASSQRLFTRHASIYRR